MNLRPALVAALSVAALSPALSHASCGSTSCSLMTDRYAQGATEAHRGWSLDLRLEAVTQDRLRAGTHTIAPADVTDEEALERHTRNTSLVTTIGYGLDADWSFTLRVPVLRRDHLHTLFDESTGALADDERWRFTRLGDMQLLARRQFASTEAGTSWALFGGLKLPTGSSTVANANGDRAERALQPGTGTTDLVIGGAWRHTPGLTDALFGQTSWTGALAAHREFKPGQRLEASVGWTHAWTPTVGSVVQLNARHRGRDAGAEAEPDLSGSTTVDLSPGVTLAVGHKATLYAYLQLPVYQDVNGLQLVPRRALALGWTVDF